MFRYVPHIFCHLSDFQTISRFFPGDALSDDIEHIELFALNLLPE